MLTELAGHLTYESHKPRSTSKDLLRLLSGRLRCHRRHADSCRCRGSPVVRGRIEAEEVPFELDVLLGPKRKF